MKKAGYHIRGRGSSEEPRRGAIAVGTGSLPSCAQDRRRLGAGQDPEGQARPSAAVCAAPRPCTHPTRCVLLSLILLLPWGLEQVPKVSRGPSQFALGGKRGRGVTPKQGSGQGEGVLSTWQWPLLRHPYADGITAKWSRPQPTSSPSRSARAHRRVWGASRNVGCRLPLRAGCGHWRLQSPRVLWMPSQVSKASSEQRFLHSVPLFWELLGQTPSPTVFITGALSSLYPLRVPTWRWAEHGKKSNVVPQCI